MTQRIEGPASRFVSNRERQLWAAAAVVTAVILLTLVFGAELAARSTGASARLNPAVGPAR